MRRPRFISHFNWRMLLMRIALNSIALTLVVAILPNIYFVQISVSNILLLAIVMGVLNAFVKPIIQFLTLPLVFATFGIVLVLVNAAMIILLAILFPTRLAVDSIWASMLGGLLFGIISSFFEALFGLTIPIVPEEEKELRKRLEGESAMAKRMTAFATATPELGNELVANDSPETSDATDFETTQANAAPISDDDAEAEDDLEPGDITMSTGGEEATK